MIKVIEGLEPWEVMKRASEGEPVAYKAKRTSGSGFIEKETPPLWNWDETIYAIIDTTEPVIDWEQFDYVFFNQYGGLLVQHSDNYISYPFTFSQCPSERDLNTTVLRESPFYYWPGGKRPVPGNVEIGCITRRANIQYIGRADTVDFGHVDEVLTDDDIIAFRLTGNML